MMAQTANILRTHQDVNLLGKSFVRKSNIDGKKFIKNEWKRIKVDVKETFYECGRYFAWWKVVVDEWRDESNELSRVGGESVGNKSKDFHFVKWKFEIIFFR